MKRLIKILGVILVVAGAIAAASLNTDSIYAKDSSGDYVIVIDAGHGGNDAGASSVKGDTEAKLNWNIAMSLKAELQTYSGVKVYMTKGSAEYQSNAARGRTGMSLGADYVISVHNNSSSSASSNGVIVYSTLKSQYKTAGKDMANAIASEIHSLGIAYSGSGYGTRESSTVAGRDFYTVIDEATDSGAVGLIIEHCFLSNASDAAFIHDINNQYKLGAADATGIAKCLGLKKRGVEPGSSITLTRTYSAYMLSSNGGSYSSSNEGVAKVRSDGLITAVGEGSAVITCTAANGAALSVNVTVPAVKLVGISAGVVQTQYKNNNINKELIMVKELYSDGSAKQVSSGYTVGDLVIENVVKNGSKEYRYAKTTVSYKGFTSDIRSYHGDGTWSTHPAANCKVVGTNTDILFIPVIYDGSASNGTPVVEPATTAPVKNEKAEPLTSKESTTEKENVSVNESEMESALFEESVSNTESKYKSESAFEGSSQYVDGEGDNNHEKGSKAWVLIVCTVLLLVIAGAVYMLILNIQREKNRRRRRRRRR